MTWPYVGSHVFVPVHLHPGFALVGTENPGENESSARIIILEVPFVARLRLYARQWLAAPLVCIVERPVDVCGNHP